MSAGSEGKAEVGISLSDKSAGSVVTTECGLLRQLVYQTTRCVFQDKTSLQQDNAWIKNVQYKSVF